MKKVKWVKKEIKRKIFRVKRLKSTATTYMMVYKGTVVNSK